MFDIKIPERQLRGLENAAKAAGKKLPRELAIAVNKSGKFAKREISKQIREELAAKKKVVDTAISVRGKATAQHAGITVVVKAGKRLPLRDFGARQIRKGVSYRTSKTTGRKRIDGAFQGPRPGVMKASWRGRVFKRVGKKRLPIQQLWGPSPWGVYVKRKMPTVTRKRVRKELKKQIDARTRFLNLKASGAI